MSRSLPPGWKDVTSYARDTPAAQRVPTSFERQVGVLRLVVTRMHGAPPTLWFIRSHPTVFMEKELEAPLHDAIAECEKRAYLACKNVVDLLVPSERVIALGKRTS